MAPGGLAEAERVTKDERVPEGLILGTRLGTRDIARVIKMEGDAAWFGSVLRVSGVERGARTGCRAWCQNLSVASP